MVQYRWEEGVEQKHREPLACKDVAGTLLWMFLKCLGAAAISNTEKPTGEIITSVFSAGFGCCTVNNAWRHIMDNKKY